MEKNILNEIAKMRKMMGLNEGRSISGVYYDTTIMSELESIVGNLHKIAPYVLEIGHRVYGNIDGGVSVYEESTLVKKFSSVEDFLKGIRYGAQKIENESNNGEMGYNTNFLGENDSNETIGIVSDRGNLYPGYFKDGDLVSLGDDIAFDNSGKLLKLGGGFPENGIKKHSSKEELEKDICANYEEILELFREDAPEEVSLNEGTYQIIQNSVECNI